MKKRMCYQQILWLGFILVALVGCDRDSTQLVELPPPNPLVAKELPTISARTLSFSSKDFIASSNLGIAEATKILGGFSYNSSIAYALTNGKKSFSLKEKYNISQHSNGSFQATVSNNFKKGYTILWTGKKLFWKGLYEPFRKVSTSAEQAKTWQERGFGRWRSIVSIFGRYMLVTGHGDGEVLNRTCNQYELSLQNQPNAQKEWNQKKTGTAWSGNLPELTRGKAAYKKRIPTEIFGKICVEAKTGLVLKAKFQGKYNIRMKDQLATMSIEFSGRFLKQEEPVLAEPKEAVSSKMAPDFLNAFGGKKPFFLQTPPNPKEK